MKPCGEYRANIKSDTLTSWDVYQMLHHWRLLDVLYHRNDYHPSESLLLSTRPVGSSSTPTAGAVRPLASRSTGGAPCRATCHTTWKTRYTSVWAAKVARR